MDFAFLEPRSSPAPGLTACSCSCGRAFAPRFFRAGLAASPLRFATVVVTLSGDLLSGHKSWPMPGTLGTAVTRRPRHRPGRAVFPHPVPRWYSLPRRRLLAACLLLPAVRFAYMLRPDTVRCKFPLQAAYFRQVLPLVVGFPHLRVLCLIRLPNGMRRASPPACSGLPSVHLGSGLTLFPGFPFRVSIAVYRLFGLPSGQEPMGPPGFSDASVASLPRPVDSGGPSHPRH